MVARQEMASMPSGGIESAVLVADGTGGCSPQCLVGELKLQCHWWWYWWLPTWPGSGLNAWRSRICWCTSCRSSRCDLTASRTEVNQEDAPTVGCVAWPAMACFALTDRTLLLVKKALHMGWGVVVQFIWRLNKDSRKEIKATASKFQKLRVPKYKTSSFKSSKVLGPNGSEGNQKPPQSSKFEFLNF